jgi:hypothetical protein
MRGTATAKNHLTWDLRGGTGSPGRVHSNAVGTEVQGKATLKKGWVKRAPRAPAPTVD